MNIEDYLNELRSVVNIDCGTKTTSGVAKVAEIMSGLYTKAGWHSELVDLGDKVGPGVFVTNKPQATQFDVLLMGHLDSVFPEGTVAERPMSVANGRVYGPSTSDMKSGLLNILWVLRSLDEADRQRLSIAVAMNPDEETGSVHSSKWFNEIAKRSRVVLVAEAARADGSLVKARKGRALYHFNFTGVAAHAGNDPEKGRSAITALAHCIVAVNQLADMQKGTTLNFGVISGGDTANVVAAQAQAVLDVRFSDNQEYERVHQALQRLCQTPFLPDVTTQLQQQTHYPAMSPNSDTEKFMRLVEQAGQKEGIDIRWQAVGGGSDANHTAALGVPSLDGFGPIGANFHSPAEYFELDSVEPRIRLLRRVLMNL